MIRIYASETCAWCGQVQKLLEHKKATYEKIMIDNDRETQKWLYKITGSTTVPVTLLDEENFVVGYNAGNLIKLIERSR